MALFLKVPKVILIKILLCSISVCSAYEYGYHPSAEEFDNLMRETRRTWTGDLLANERRRADTWTHNVSPKRRYVGADAVYSFLPKYKKHFEPNRYATTTPFYWPNPIAAQQAQAAPEMHDRNDQQSESSNMNGPNQIGSSLGFSMFGGEMQPSAHEHQSAENPPILLSETNVFSGLLVPNATTTRSPLIFKRVPPAASHSKNDTLATNTHNIPFSETTNNSTYPTPIFYSNQSVSQLPIFFTNPATGIVYAITEVGKVQDNATLSNDSIPIYITKQQYDRDLFLLKKHYERRCQAQKLTNANSSKDSVISTSNSSTMRPQIIRLKKPPVFQSVSKLPTAKTSIPLQHKQPQVMLQTALDAGNHMNLPTQKRKQKITKRKRKKQKKSPGRKPTSNGPATQSLPAVIMGTRHTERPTVSVDRVPTQLEKPASMPMTIFSSRPVVSVKKTIMPQPKHTIRRRSVTNARVLNSRFHGRAFFRQAREVEVPATSTFEVHKADTTTLSPTTTTVFARVAFLEPAVTVKSVEQPLKVTARAAMRSTTQRPRTRATKKRKKSKKTSKATDDYDLFGLYADEDDDDDNDDEYEDEDVNEDEEEEEVSHENEKESAEVEANDVYYENDKRTKPHIKPKPFITAKSYNRTELHNSAKPHNTPKPHNTIKPHQQISQTFQKPTYNVPLNDMQYQNLISDTSSAEPDVDYGALYESPEIIASSTEEQTRIGSNKKHPLTKKRTRRRPSSQKVQYYYDDYAEDDADSGGIGSFFSMLFYPVQVVMEKIFDSYSQKDASYSSSEESQDLPTYTLYNNVAQKGDNFESDDVQGNSLSEWLSSWFGFNRRTKKISSTTAAPTPPPVSLPTEAPGWFDSWFGYGSGKTTTEASYEDYDDDKWFFNWFDTKSKSKRRRDTTTTTTTSLPQVPILTIVDPLRNPQNWIGILAHHIINSTATSTHNPLIEAFTRATTTTTTEDPDIPRKINYEKYQIWRLKPQSNTQVKTLEEYKKSDEGVKLQWLKGPSLRGLNDVLVPPKMLFDFQATLNFESIAHEILIFDVGKAIAYEKSKEQYLYTTTHRPNKHQRNPPLAMSWNNYYEYDEIIKYLESIRLRHPQMIELLHIGRSYEGRPLIIVKIESKQTAAATAASLASHKKLKFKKKSGHANAVFIEAGTHGLEWIGPATSTWMINELLRIMKSNKTDVDLDFVKNTTWYILPVLNPDGYVYTHEYDRFWKKSRSRHISRPGGLITSAMTWLQQRKVPDKVCYGVDLDRNWHYLWGRRGSSKSPCNEFYAGPVPFSEPETKALSEFLMDYRKQIKLYISLQAYGQVLSYPNKANYSFNSEKMDDFLDVAMVSTDGLRKKGSKSRYKIDSTNDLMENRAGCSDAFAAYEVGIPFSYTLHLADNGVHGYLLPSSSIESTARDAFEIITAMIDYI